MSEDPLLLPDIYLPVFWDCVDKSPHPKGCWLWTGQTNSDGYGRFVVRKRTLSAHRITCRMKHGPLAHGICACHTCDNPLCVNPDHLFPGTKLDNARDREAKGRGRQPTGDRHHTHLYPERIPRGNDHWAARHPERYNRGNNHHARKNPEKMSRGDGHWTALHPELIRRGVQHTNVILSEDSVREIRRLYAEKSCTLNAMAERFGVTISSIRKVVYNKQWTHVK